MHAARLVISWILVGLVGAGCDAGKRDERVGPSAHAEAVSQTPAPDIPGLDTSEMTEHEQTTFSALLASQLSPCGDPRTLQECAPKPDKCGACVPAAQYLARLVMEGFEPKTIAEQYKQRFQDAPASFEMEGAPVRGAPMAPVTIVEFSDFQCPHCARAAPMLEELVVQYADRVKLVFKHFPLSGHTRALAAAKAAEAARLQDKFWQMHDLLFKHQTQLEDQDLIRYAQIVGLDVERFQRDMASEGVAQRVEENLKAGRAVGVDSTPSLFINGHRFGESPRTLAAYIQEELAR